MSRTIVPLVLAMAVAYCGDSGTQPVANTPPTAAFYSVEQVQLPPSPLEVQIVARDTDTNQDAQLSQIEFRIRPEGQEWQNLGVRPAQGQSTIRTFTTPELERGTHDLKAIVRDATGDSAVEQMTHRVIGGNYHINLSELNLDSIRSLAGETVCLGTICGETDNQGNLTLQDVIDDQRVRVGDSNHFVGLRHPDQDNFFQQTPYLQAQGELPQDTSVEAGENYRNIVVVSEGFPIEEIINRWFVRQDSTMRFAHPNGDIRVHPKQSETPMSSEYVNKVVEVFGEALKTIDEEVYEFLPFPETPEYDVVLGNTVSASHPDKQGRIYLIPSNQYFHHFTGRLSDNVAIGLYLYQDMTQHEQERLWHAKNAFWRMACGVHEFDSQGGTFTSDQTIKESGYVLEPTTMEIAACRLGVLYNSETSVRLPEE